MKRIDGGSLAASIADFATEPTPGRARLLATVAGAGFTTPAFQRAACCTAI